MFFGTRVLGPASAHLTPLFMRARQTSTKARQGAAANSFYCYCETPRRGRDAASSRRAARGRRKESSGPEEPEARHERVAPGLGRQEVDWTRVHSTCTRPLSKRRFRASTKFCGEGRQNLNILWMLDLARGGASHSEACAKSRRPRHRVDHAVMRGMAATALSPNRGPA